MAAMRRVCNQRECPRSAASWSLIPQTVARAWFHSGLDAARIQRLRTSSVVFNRLRGRDVLSIEFEKRISLRPMIEAGDVYRGVTGGVAVVVPVSQAEVDVGCIPLPSVCPFHYNERLFPRRLPLCASASTTAAADATAVDMVQTSPTLPEDATRFLRRDADSFRIVLRGVGGDGGGGNNHDGGDGGLLVLVVDPTLDVPQYRREEAQVEMITAYRNILCEVAESYMDGNGSSSSGSHHKKAHAAPASVLRIPALCAYTAGEQFEPELAKLSQQSIIKGFHRVSNAAKEALMMQTDFRIELFVPPTMLESFQSAFLEEAWAPPTSTVAPGRLNLYPGLAPPEKLLELEGWVGRREELVEAVATGGKSLEATTQLTLDGRIVQQNDAHASIDVFGGRGALKQMLEGERRTAEARGLKEVFADHNEATAATAAAPTDTLPVGGDDSATSPR